MNVSGVWRGRAASQADNQLSVVGGEALITRIANLVGFRSTVGERTAGLGMHGMQELDEMIVNRDRGTEHPIVN